MVAVLVVGLKYYQDSRQAVEENSQEEENQDGHTPFDGIGPPPPPTPITGPPELGIYWESNCSTTVEAVEWGMLSPGETKSVTLYFRNEGDTKAVPSLNTSNWVFQDFNGTDLSEEYRDYFSLSWDYNSTAIEANQIVGVVLSLSVFLDIQEQDVVTFAFDIVIGW